MFTSVSTNTLASVLVTLDYFDSDHNVSDNSIIMANIIYANAILQHYNSNTYMQHYKSKIIYIYVNT